MLCVRLSIPCRYAFSQTRRKARVRRCSLLFDSPAGRIYRAHLVTLFFAFVLGSFFLSELPGIRNLLDSYLMNPWAAIGGSLALLFRPPLMDILPMYVLFSFLTPAAFGAAQRWGWKTVLFVSFSVWGIAQTHVRDMLVSTLCRTLF